MAPCRKILLVEADPVSRANLAIVLGRLGHVVRCAASGSEALEEMRTHPPHLVLVDLQTIKQDGGSFFRRRRQERSLADIPLVVLSAPDRAQSDDDLPGDVTHLPNVMDPDRLLAALGRLTARPESDTPSGGSGN